MAVRCVCRQPISAGNRGRVVQAMLKLEIHLPGCRTLELMLQDWNAVLCNRCKNAITVSLKTELLL